MTSRLAEDLMVATAFATLLVIIGAVSLAAAVRWHGKARATALLLAWAMAEHLFDITGSAGFQQLAIVQQPWLVWLGETGGYFVAVPWALLVEQVVGVGWKKSIRRTWQVYLASAIAGVLFDVAAGRPGSVAGPMQAIIAAGAAVGFLNVSPGLVRGAPDLRVLRAGYLCFMLLVVHDALVQASVLPWGPSSGPAGLLIFIAALGYTVVSRTVRTQRELQAIEQELATARRIQTLLLPSEAPRLEGASLAFRYLPAAAVAGDLFEFLDAGPHRLGILVADVSGHGVAAALIASMVKVAAAAQRPHADDPTRVLSGIHLAIADQIPQGQFVTAVYVFVDLERGVLRHASAGHPPALVWRAADASVTPAGATGPLIISFAPPAYPCSELTLNAGDRVVLYTDGIIEAMRDDGEMFGIERLIERVRRSEDGPEGLAAAVMDGVSRFLGRNTQALDDDCTLVALEITPVPVHRGAFSLGT